MLKLQKVVSLHIFFLLLEIKFITVLNDSYIAITIQIIFVVLSENHKGIKPPIVNSPNGRPQTNSSTLLFYHNPAHNSIKF